MLNFKSLWERVVIFFNAVVAALGEFAHPSEKLPEPELAVVIRRDGTIDFDYNKEEEHFPSFDITNQLLILLADLGKTPKEVINLGYDPKRKKFEQKVWLELDDSTVAAAVYMKNLTASDDYERMKYNLENAK